MSSKRHKVDATPPSSSLLGAVRAFVGPAFIIGGWQLTPISHSIGVLIVYIGFGLCLAECIWEPVLLAKPYQLQVALIGVVFTLAGAFTIGFVLIPGCSVSVSVNSAMLTRAHLRATWHATGSGGGTTDVYKPVFQDIFHEWTIEVTPTKEASQVVVSIKDARWPTDKIRVVPQENVSIISEPKPGWVSGFEEPTQAPDVYTRTITFSRLSTTATIMIRRPIKGHFGDNRITSLDLDLDRQVLVSADRCDVHVAQIFTSNPLSELNPHFNELVEQLKVLLVQHVTGGPIPTRPDPDEPYPPLTINESELVEEAKCKDPKCGNLLITMIEKTRVH